MQVIPTQAVPSQTLRVQLNEQDCVFRIYQKSTGLYIDVQVDGEVIVYGALCRDRVVTVRQEYLGFLGDVAFMDMTGTQDPYYTGLNDRYLFIYLEPDET